MIEILVNHYADGNKARFPTMLGIKPQTLSMWLSRNSFDAELLFSRCEDLSGDWLLSGGKGEMLRSVNIISADHGGIAAGGSVSGSTTLGAGSTVNNYNESCTEDKHSLIVKTLTESVATLTRELMISQEQKSNLINIIDKLTNR